MQETSESLGSKRKSRVMNSFDVIFNFWRHILTGISSNPFKMADTEVNGTRELLEGLTIAEETSHHSGQSVYTNQLIAFLH